MTKVTFTVHHDFAAPPRAVWDELVDWEGHAEWIPMTRMDVEPGDPTAPGARFTAYSGVGRVALEDRMQVVECTWDDDAQRGYCEVEKLGPVLTGRAGFTIEPKGDGSALEWFEDVDARYVPRFASGLAARAGAAGFKQGMKRLAKLLDERVAAG